jgi:hypothetical protein
MRVTTAVSDPYIGESVPNRLFLWFGAGGETENRAAILGGLVRCRVDRFPPVPPPPQCPIDCTRSRVVLASDGVASTRNRKPSHRE